MNGETWSEHGVPGSLNKGNVGVSPNSKYIYDSNK